MKSLKTISPTDLNTIIMSVVHDVKNSLLLSSATLEKVSLELSSTQQIELDKVQNEIKGVNQSLMRMLTLYKMQSNLFSLHQDQHNIYDMLEELVIINTSSMSSSQLKFEIQCDDELEWFFDLELINNVINSIINNTLRYAKHCVTLKAIVKKEMLAISVLDDGLGYPEKMLAQEKKINTEVNFKMGNSGLGLFFAETIAKLHNFKGKQGFTLITNIKSGGGCFTLYLP